jgi:hypothetical protein
MNNELAQQLIAQAGFSRTYEPERTRRLIELVVLECARAVNHSPVMNYQYPAYTPGSYIINHFGINNEQDQDK